jgi:hypothetical protein
MYARSNETGPPRYKGLPESKSSPAPIAEPTVSALYDNSLTQCHTLNVPRFECASTFPWLNLERIESGYWPWYLQCFRHPLYPGTIEEVQEVKVVWVIGYWALTSLLRIEAVNS